MQSQTKYFKLVLKGGLLEGGFSADGRWLGKKQSVHKSNQGVEEDKASTAFLRKHHNM